MANRESMTRLVEDARRAAHGQSMIASWMDRPGGAVPRLPHGQDPEQVLKVLYSDVAMQWRVLLQLAQRLDSLNDGPGR